MRRCLALATLAAGVLLSLGSSPAQNTAQPLPQSPQQRDLADASLEELTQIRITVSSFARKDEDLWKTPAAVFVITRDDITHSSLSSIPELLRLVPGLQVAEIDASTWAVSARGFNSVYAAKLLVLVDGRNVYSEIYSGAHWDEVDLPLETIERIEVIRGPGAAVWGTNAVNGVINIITRKARETTGLLISGSVSNTARKLIAGYGTSLGERIQFRASAGVVDRSPFVTAAGLPSFDGSRTLRAGTQIAWQPDRNNEVYTSADFYDGRLKQEIIPEIAVPLGPGGDDNEALAGGSVLTRWTHHTAVQDTSFQFYFDDQSRHELAGYARTRTLDFEYQNHRRVGLRNDLVWGAESRFTFDHLGGLVLPTLLPEYRNFLLDGFIQDEIPLIPSRLIATLGSKIQQGSLAGFQVQPSARLLWAPNRQQSLWLAVSRAAVAPSIQDKDVAVPLSLGTEAGLPILGTLLGDPSFKPETVVAFEMGYRRTIARNLTADLASFVNNNLRIQADAFGASSLSLVPTPHVQAALSYSNGFRARTGGAEAALSWVPTPALSCRLSYAWMEAHTHQVDPGESAIADAWNTPRNTLAISSSWSLSKFWQASSFLYRTGGLPFSGLSPLEPAAAAAAAVPGYTRLDLQLTRKLGNRVQLEAGGRNLLTPRHLEFGGTGFNVPSDVPRSVFLRGILSF